MRFKEASNKITTDIHFRRIALPVKDIETFNLIEKLGEHYRVNINNRYLRSALISMDLSPSSRTGIEALTERSEYFRLQGYRFDELYVGIMGVAQFIYKARTEILPNLKYHIKTATDRNEKILQNMAVENFKTNLGILADDVNDLYQRTVQIDKESHKVKKPVFERTPELENLGQLLTSSNQGIMR